MPTRPADTSHSHRHLHIQTTCGRRISVGLLVLGSTVHPAKRISLDIGPAGGTGDGTWAGLTAREARDLAAALLAQVAAAEHAVARDRQAIAVRRARIYPGGYLSEEAGR